MSNNEQTIDQELTSEVLKEIAGGPHIRYTWTFKTLIHPDYSPPGSRAVTIPAFF